MSKHPKNRSQLLGASALTLALLAAGGASAQAAGPVVQLFNPAGQSADFNALVEGRQIASIIAALTNPNSAAWQAIKGDLTKNFSQYRISVSDFQGTNDTPEALFSRFLLTGQFSLTGTITLDIEGLTPWPLPDPQPVFNWTLAVWVTCKPGSGDCTTSPENWIVHLSLTVSFAYVHHSALFGILTLGLGEIAISAIDYNARALPAVASEFQSLYFGTPLTVAGLTFSSQLLNSTTIEYDLAFDFNKFFGPRVGSGGAPSSIIDALRAPHCANDCETCSGVCGSATNLCGTVVQCDGSCPCAPSCDGSQCGASDGCGGTCRGACPGDPFGSNCWYDSELYCGNTDMGAIFYCR